jgi:photosynthetic reaction center cytochrome c subunit
MKTISMKMLAVLGLSTVLLAGCERPPIDAVQGGYRGTGMAQVYNPRAVEKQIPLNQPPEDTPAASPDGPKAKDIYQNVKVLGDLSVAEFARHMAAVTAWVAPEEGCAYCHNVQNFAEDSKYTKIVGRRMIQMTQHINSQWKSHVADTGVTCYTCHRGKHIPDYVWSTAAPQKQTAGLLGDKAGQNTPAPIVGLSSLPYDPFTEYLKGESPISVGGKTALPTGNRTSTKQAEHTYALMMHFSSSLGVNCTYCHNAQHFGAWDSAPPQKATAWYGIRMARDINLAYMEPLAPVFPDNRKGPMGDVLKANCQTCHQGAYKPVYGAQMAKSHPELLSASYAATAAAPAAVAAAPAGTGNIEPVKLYFDTGKFDMPADAGAQLQALVDYAKANADSKLGISGYHDKTGSVDANAELAKNRAVAVRELLKKAGVAEDRIVMQKPTLTEGGADNKEARRVEVYAAK